MDLSYFIIWIAYNKQRPGTGIPAPGWVKRFTFQVKIMPGIRALDLWKGLRMFPVSP